MREGDSPVYRYFDVIRNVMDIVQASERESMERASELIAEAIARGRVLHYFGAGHSHMLGDELFYIAGGLVPVNAIQEPGLMVVNGASKSTKMEQLPGLAAIVSSESQLNPGDVILIASNSGVNQVPVEAAAEAKKAGANVIALTSVSSSRAIPVLNSEGVRLCDLADVVIDTHVPHGDAAVQVDGMDQKVGPVSTAIGVAIVNALVVRVVEKLIERGIETPVLTSANVPGGVDQNAAQLARYRSIVRSL